jgi:hypothetical protein
MNVGEVHSPLAMAAAVLVIFPSRLAISFSLDLI